MKSALNFIILFAILMSLIEQVLDNISHKQEEKLKKINIAFRMFLSGNAKDFAKKLVQEFSNHFEESLNKHSNKIRQYLFVQNANDENLLFQVNQHNNFNALPQDKEKGGEERLNRNVQSMDNHFKLKINHQIDVQKKQIKKRKKLTKNDQDINYNPQPQPKIDYGNKKNLYPQYLQQSNPSQQRSKHKTIENKKDKNFNIKQKQRTQSNKQKQANANGPILISHPRQQSRKNHQQEKYTSKGKSFKEKSSKLKINLIKLTPIAQQKQRQMKIKEANEKIQAALEFLNNLPSRRKVTSLHANQWRQQKSDSSLVQKNNSSPVNPNYLKLKELAEKYRQQQSHQLEANILQRSDFSRKLYSKLQKTDRFTLQKPRPYNLYNINMLKNQVFQLKKTD